MTQYLRYLRSPCGFMFLLCLFSGSLGGNLAESHGSTKTNDKVVKLGKKRVIGATATVEEVRSDLLFRARVDTGATTTSLHVEEFTIEDEAERMEDNVGKKIRFRMTNQDGKSEWIESRISEVSVVKTSVDEELRYKVLLTLRLYEVKKKVLVTLKNRAHMKYPMLLGRNFLRGDFVVDVESKRPKKSPPTDASKKNESPAPAARTSSSQEEMPEQTLAVP